MLVGIDIEDIQKMKEIIEGIDFHNYEGVLNSVFSLKEIKYCLSKKNPAKYFAVRFSGKEALLKALGTGLRGDMIMSDIQFLNDKDGQPYVICSGQVKKRLKENNVRKINVSFSHTKETAIAVVILETKKCN